MLVVSSISVPFFSLGLPVCMSINLYIWHCHLTSMRSCDMGYVHFIFETTLIVSNLQWIVEIDGPYKHALVNGLAMQMRRNIETDGGYVSNIPMWIGVTYMNNEGPVLNQWMALFSTWLLLKMVCQQHSIASCSRKWLMSTHALPECCLYSLKTSDHYLKKNPGKCKWSDQEAPHHTELHRGCLGAGRQKQQQYCLAGCSSHTIAFIAIFSAVLYNPFCWFQRCSVVLNQFGLPEPEKGLRHCRSQNPSQETLQISVGYQ